jgi:ABC-2 type transport system permease protein
MSAALTITRVTTRQLVGGRRAIWLVLVAIAPAVIFGIATSNITRSELYDPFIGFVVVGHFSVVVPIVTLAFAGPALGQERRGHTLSFLVLRPLPRWSIAAAKFGGAFAAGYLVTGLGALALGVVYGLRAGDWAWIAPLLVGTAVGGAIYAAIFLPLGYATKHATLIGLGFWLIWENGIVSAIPGLAWTSPWRNGFSAFVDLAPVTIQDDVLEFGLGSLTPGMYGAGAKAILWIIAGLAVTTVLLRRRDLA